MPCSACCGARDGKVNRALLRNSSWPARKKQMVCQQLKPVRLNAKAKQN